MFITCCKLLNKKNFPTIINLLLFLKMGNSQLQESQLCKKSGRNKNQDSARAFEQLSENVTTGQHMKKEWINLFSSSFTFRLKMNNC
jgi:hypothetical protein